MTAATRRAATPLIVAALLVPALAVSPAHGARADLTVTDSRPIRGEKVQIRADLPGTGARNIRLQRRAGTRWVTVATRRSDRRVAATFTRRVAAPTTFRAETVRGSKRLVSSRVTVRPRVQIARLAIPTRATEGQMLSVTAVFTPARSRRAVSVELRTGSTWRTIATTRQDNRGRATVAVRASESGSYRVVTAAHRGAARVASTATRVTVAPAASPHSPPPTPTAGPTSPPEPTTPIPTLDPPITDPTPGLPDADAACDLPAGGTVEWGDRDNEYQMRKVARLDVTTDDGQAITSRTDYSRSTLVLTEADADPVTIPGRLRLRGNSTSWVNMKYPYKVKLDARTSVHGMPPSKDWVLLANFYDRSLLRNDVGLETARRLGAQWAARLQPVELWLNGVNKGLYQFGEGIRAEKHRVELPTGAMLLEADRHDDTDPRFTTRRDLQVFVKSTEDTEEVARATERVRTIEDVLYSSRYADPEVGYRSCLDVPSFVDAYINAELTKNVDAAFNNSVWMVLGADGRLAMGPAWDFDQAMGNRHTCDLVNPQGWFINRNWLDPFAYEGVCAPTQMRGPQGHWYRRLLTDPWFVEQVRTRWAEVRGSLAGLPDYVDASAATISEAAQRNFAPPPEGAWMPIGPSILDPDTQSVFHGNWPAETAALSDWMRHRIAWLDVQFG